MADGKFHNKVFDQGVVGEVYGKESYELKSFL